MANGSTLHSLRLVTLHHWWTDYGQAQLEPSGLQKGEELGQVLALFFGILSPSVVAGHLVVQILEVCLNRVTCLARILDLTLQRGNLLSELTALPTNRGQRGGTFLLCLQQLLSGLPHD
jgi:hypothetical protein